MSSCVHDYINTLPESYRAVVTLSEIEGLTNQEIAGLLGLALDTVEFRLHRGRSKLKEKLEIGCSFDRDEQDIPVCVRKTDTDHSVQEFPEIRSKAYPFPHPVRLRDTEGR